MSKINVKAGELLVGDYVVAAKARVVGLQRIGPLVIVDLDDMTATAPMPLGVPTDIIRSTDDGKGKVPDNL